MNKRKILGIDYGDFSIGLAVFDLETDFIYPIKTIFRDKANVLRKSVREIVDLIIVENITDIVIGLPLNADGSSGERVDKVKTFAHMLKNGINANSQFVAHIIIDGEDNIISVDKKFKFQGKKESIFENDIETTNNNKKNISISFQDERLTTIEAKTILVEKGIKKMDWKKTIDQIAAELILQDYKQANKL